MAPRLLVLPMMLPCSLPNSEWEVWDVILASDREKNRKQQTSLDKTSDIFRKKNLIFRFLELIGS